MSNEENNPAFEDALDRLRQGDSTAKKELIEIAFDRLRILAASMLNRFPVAHRWEDTDDILQRAATRLWQILDEVQPENQLHFFRLSALQIRRELLDLTRALKGPEGLATNHDSVQKRASDSVVDGNGRVPEPGSDSSEPSKLFEWGEFHLKVGELAEDEKEVFELIWYQGLSQDLVAELTSTSQKTVSRRWLRARRSLFRLLDGRLPD